MPKKKPCNPKDRESIAERTRQVLAMLEDLELDTQVDVIAMTAANLLLRDAMTKDGPCTHQAILLFQQLLYDIIENAKADITASLAQARPGKAPRVEH